MPTVIRYDELTWPEVADLPRDLPMVIPLGLGEYDLTVAAQTLDTDWLCLLPAIPYGFRRADDDWLGKLAVGPGLLRRALLGVQRELEAQRFGRVVFLNGHGDQGVKSHGLEIVDCPISNLQYPMSNLQPPTPNQVVVIGTGHTEQHGHHLPLSTDTLIVQAILSGLAEALPGDVFTLPVWPYGVSTHTRQFPATLNLGGRVFEDFMLAIVGRLVAQGTEMVYFQNGHGGNHSFLVNVVKYAGERWPGAFTATEFLYLSGAEGAAALQKYRQSPRGGMGHACELETSLVLHLRPELVLMDKATDELDFVSTPNYYMDWVEGGSLIANPPWTDDTLSGPYGAGTLGTAEKGRLWLEAAIVEKVARMAEVREQHERRKAKRKNE
jgi:creatinine amidohydrolase